MQKKTDKSVLIVWGGWQGHTPHECAELFHPWLQSKGWKVTLSDSLDIFANQRRMRNFNLIIPIWTMGQISSNQWQGLQQAVLNGAGLAGWHGGMCDAFRNNPGYQFMTGGQWVAHPGGIINYQVKITNHSDPITKGLHDFRIKSEQYYMHTDPGNKVLATTTFSGKHDNIPWIKGTVMPVVWKRLYGKGRIFYSALGHNADDFSKPEIIELMKRGIMWAINDKIIPEYTP